jgi:hypothetical protein
MADPKHLATAPTGRPGIEACWMCGIHLPAAQMMPDGGGACTDVRWYCRDTWECTQRWTARPARTHHRVDSHLAGDVAHRW